MAHEDFVNADKKSKVAGDPVLHLQDFGWKTHGMAIIDGHHNQVSTTKM